MTAQTAESTYLFTYLIVCLACAVSGVTIAAQVTTDMGSVYERKTFRKFVVAYIAFVVTNAFCAFANVNQIAAIGVPFTALNEIAISVCVYEWFSYVEYETNAAGMESSLYQMLSRIPLFAIIVFVASSPFTHYVFYYDSEGGFRRGPFYTLILGTAFLYLVYAFFHVLVKLIRTRSRSERDLCFLLLSFLLFPFAAGIIDVLIPRIPVFEMLSLLGIVIIYVNLQQAQIKVDALTGLGNRRAVQGELGDRLGAASEEEPVIFFMSDVDRFKEINDRYGHAEGDRALRIVAGVFGKIAAETGADAARWGGDEFVLAGSRRRVGDPRIMIRRMDQELARAVRDEALPYGITMSTGYAVCASKNTKLDDATKEADRMLYEAKKNRRGA